MSADVPAVPSAVSVFHEMPAKNNKQILRPITKSKHMSRRDREMAAANMELRQKLPYLTKQETMTYRYSFKHNLCLDMLQAGFHSSFRELFRLLQKQADERERAGPDSVMWTKPQLQHQNDNLEKIKEELARAEEADRAGIHIDNYNARYKLATYFMEKGDKWLAEHFFMTCLEISLNSRQESGQVKAEGHCNVGLQCQESGNYLQAAYHFEESYKLTSHGTPWLNRHGSRMHTDSCMNLCSIYTIIGESVGKTNFEEGVLYFQKAYDMARESNEAKRIAESGYKLGLAYVKINNNNMSLKYLREYLDQCQRQGDVDGIGKACDAIAAIYREQGNIHKCTEYLRIFVGVAESSKNDEAYGKACRNLGTIYNYTGQYNEATENFSKSYNLSRSANDPRRISVNRVLYGISMAHTMLGRCSEHINNLHPSSLQCLSDWKSARTDDFVAESRDESRADGISDANTIQTVREPISEEDEGSHSVPGTVDNSLSY